MCLLWLCYSLCLRDAQQEGMGSMKIKQGGLWLSGQTVVTDRLVASSIRSRPGRPLVFESTANVTLNARNSQGRLLNSLKLSKYDDLRETSPFKRFS